jgi:hypothetical protein
MLHGIRTRFVHLRRERPTAAMVVAVTALSFAVAGTSVAGAATVNALSKQEKKQVTRIAAKQIKKKARGLSVARSTSAGTAARADTAGRADTAARADTAQRADTAGRATNIYAANVDADGTMIGSIPAGATSTRVAQGIYRVNFPRSPTGCLLFAALGSNDGSIPPGTTGVIPATNEDPNRVAVATYGVLVSGTGALADRDFYVQMTCP